MTVNYFSQLPVLNYLAPVVQRLDNAIHRINHYHAFRWIVIYPVDSVIRLLNNCWGQNFC